MRPGGEWFCGSDSERRGGLEVWRRRTCPQSCVVAGRQGEGRENGKFRSQMIPKIGGRSSGRSTWWGKWYPEWPPILIGFWDAGLRLRKSKRDDGWLDVGRVRPVVLGSGCVVADWSRLRCNRD